MNTSEIRKENIAIIQKAHENYRHARNDAEHAEWNLISTIQEAIKQEIGDHLPPKDFSKPIPRPRLSKLLAVAEMLGLLD